MGNAGQKVLSKKERELAAFIALEDYLEVFLKRWVRPEQPLPVLTQALEEVGSLKLLMMARRYDGAPTIRKNKK